MFQRVAKEKAGLRWQKSNGGASSQVNDPNGLSLPHLIAAVITAVIGGGVFTMAGDMAAAGAEYGAVLIGWVVCGIGVFSLMMCFYALSKYKSELVGGIYSYARAGWGEFMGFISAYGYWISALLATVSLHHASVRVHLVLRSPVRRG